MFGFSLFFLFCIAQLAQGAVPQSSRSRGIVGRVTPGIRAEMSSAGLQLGAKVFFRAFKVGEQKLRQYVSTPPQGAVYNSQSESGATLELWVEQPQGAGKPLIRFKSYPICMYSGLLGPKKREGDGQTIEVFYSFPAGSFNPSSSYRLSFNTGYPNMRDRALGYTGGLIMVHGECVSIGCFAMGNPFIDEIWTIAAAAADAGQRSIPFHSFPFPMTRENIDIAVHALPHLASFWNEIQPGYDAFERTRQVPSIAISGRNYIVSAVGSPVQTSFDDRSGRRQEASTSETQDEESRVERPSSRSILWRVKQSFRARNGEELSVQEGEVLSQGSFTEPTAHYTPIRRSSGQMGMVPNVVLTPA